MDYKRTRLLNTLVASVALWRGIVLVLSHQLHILSSIRVLLPYTNSPTPKSMIPQEAAHSEKKVRLSSREKFPVYEREIPDGSYFEKMPNEMLFEIFSRLLPRDLLLLSRTNKFLRRFLMLRKNSSIWKMALKVVDAPKCPEFMPIPHWVDLIFGNRICYLCGSPNDLLGWLFGYEINWDIQRRLCSECKKSPAREIRPVINVTAGEAKSLKRTVIEYQTRILNERAQEIRNRLVNRGWREDAVGRVQRYMKLADDICANVLTESEWQRILPSLENDVAVQEQKILSEEHKCRVASRTENGETVYMDYLKTLPPSRWASFPEWEELSIEEPLRALLNSSETTTVSKDELEASFDIFKDAIQTWRKRNSDKFQSMLPEFFRAKHNAPVTETSNGSLGLAVAVFQRKHCGNEYRCRCWAGGGPAPLVGWEDVIVPSCWESWEDELWRRTWNKRPQTEVTFSERGSAAAASLVQALGLDQETARPCDLDASGRTFFCEICPPVCKDGEWTKWALSWRDCVMHCKHPAAGTTHQEPRWKILSPQKAQYAEAKTEYHIDIQEVWTCDLCTKTVDSMYDRYDVIRHVMVKHHISDPVMNRDYFIAATKKVLYCLPWPPCIPVCKGKGKHSVYRCRHCTRGKKCLYTLDEIVLHLKSRHNISRPRYSIDCTEERHPTVRKLRRRA